MLVNNDTSADAQRILIEGYRRMTPGEKARRVWELNRFAHGLAMADERRRRPDATDRELRLWVAARHLDAETMRRAFGWDPREHD